jgi:hypothetical protein
MHVKNLGNKKLGKKSFTQYPNNEYLMQIIHEILTLNVLPYHASLCSKRHKIGPFVVSFSLS